MGGIEQKMETTKLKNPMQIKREYDMETGIVWWVVSASANHLMDLVKSTLVNE